MLSDIEKSDNCQIIFQEKTTPNVKKRHHRRIKSNGVKNSASNFLQSSSHENTNGASADDSGGSCGGLASNSTANSDCTNFEFHIVSLDNKQWHFEAASAEERDEWVSAIEQQILNSLQVLLIKYRLRDLCKVSPPPNFQKLLLN